MGEWERPAGVHYSVEKEVGSRGHGAVACLRHKRKLEALVPTTQWTLTNLHVSYLTRGLPLLKMSEESDEADEFCDGATSWANSRGRVGAAGGSVAAASTAQQLEAGSAGRIYKGRLKNSHFNMSKTCTLVQQQRLPFRSRCLSASPHGLMPRAPTA